MAQHNMTESNRNSSTTNALASKYRLLLLANLDWHGKTQVDKHHLTAGFARHGWDVIYSSGAQSLWQRNEERWQRAGPFASFEWIDLGGGKSFRLDAPGKLFARHPGKALWNRMAIKHQAKRLKIKCNKADGKGTIAVVFDPGFGPYLDELDADYVIFYMYDSYAHVGNWTDTDQANLELALQHSDMIVAVAASMARELPGKAPERARILPHGVDAASIMAAAAQPCPEDLAVIPHPRIGYTGRISRKFDLELMRDIATARPDWHWVCVGRIGVGFSGAAEYDKALTECRNLPNIHFLGEKHYHEIAAYQNHIDVGVVPMSVSRKGFWTVGNPMKLIEFLAAGKPVVSYDNESTRLYEDVVDIVTGKDAWIDALEKNIRGQERATPEQRQAVAMNNTWDQRIVQLEQWISELVTTKDTC